MANQQPQGNYPIDNPSSQSPQQQSPSQQQPPPPHGYQLPPNSNGYPNQIYNPQFQQPQQPSISSSGQQQQQRFMAYQPSPGYNTNPGFIPQQNFQGTNMYHHHQQQQPDPSHLQQQQNPQMMYNMMYMPMHSSQQQQQQQMHMMQHPSSQNIPIQQSMMPPPPQFTNDMNPQVYQQRLHQYRQMVHMQQQQHHQQQQQYSYAQHQFPPQHHHPQHRPSTSDPQQQQQQQGHPYHPPPPQQQQVSHSHYVQHQFRPTPHQYQQQMNMHTIRPPHYPSQQQRQKPPPQPTRKSARATKKKKVTYDESSDEELQLSEDSEPEPEDIDDSDDDGNRKRKKGDDDSDEPIVIPMGTKEFERILDYRLNEQTRKEELLIKYKYTSFHHVEWVPLKRVEGEHLGKHRVKKFLRKWEEDGQRGEDFREYLKLDRIVDEGEIEDPETGEVKIFYLCKWNASFYESCTWEKDEDAEKIDESKVEEFQARRIIPDYKIPNPPPRPDLTSFMKYDRSPTYRYGNELRSYQLEGLNWLRFCYYGYRSCILADEMGLGKTVQSVALLNDIYHSLGIKGPFIIIAPLSTIPHWERAFKAWTDLNVIDYRGSNLARNLIVDTEFYYKNAESKNIPDRYKFDVLITTYEMASSSAPLLSKIRWKCAVFDEAHRLKNKQSKVLEILRTFNVEHKLLLTGTPLQNNLDELYSLLNFMQPEVFNDEGYFFTEYGSLQTAAQVEKLQALLKPIMLRRFKEDVEKTIPVKEETIIEVELTTPQKKWYRAILEKNFSFLKKGAKTNRELPHLRNIMMQLRKCCIHPYLLEGAEEVIVSECNAVSYQEQFNCLVQSSGKLVLIDKLLKKLILGNHKVLIFSQFTSCLDILSDYLRRCKYAFERIDGSIPGDQRQASIDRFSTLPIEESFVFLLCTRAGGVGINLTAADTCIIFDSDWNPQNDLQAQARCHRIGQTKPVQIYRLICANTYEKDMFDRAGMKLGLDKAVMSRSGPTGESENGQSGKHELSKQEIEALLKKGAYGAMLDDEASTKFCEEDIDQILERRTKIIKHEGNEQGSVFSKATFSAGSDDVDGVDIDDPDFWEKWAAKANIETKDIPEEKNKLILLGSRKRRKVQRFGTKQEDANYSDNDNEDSDGAYEEEEEEEEDGGRAGRRRRRGTRSRGDDDDDDSSPVITTRRGRGRRSAASLASSSNNNSDSGSGIGRKRGGGREGAPKLWTLSEKTKYERKLMIFGYGAWEKMKIDFPRRTEKDLKAITRILMKRTLPTITKKTEEDKKLIDDIEQLLESDSKEDDPEDETIPFKGATKKQITEFRSFLIDAADDYVDHIERKGRNLLLRIQMLHIIRDKIVPQNWSAAKVMPMPTVAGAQPAKWWGSDEDRSLILGICKHGYQQYLDMRNDPEFCFYGKKYEDNDEDEEATATNNEKLDDEEENGSGSENEDTEKDNTKTTSAEGDEEGSKENEKDTAIAETSKNDDEEMEEQKDDEEKDETYKDETETAEDDGTVYIWPSKAEIGMRLRRVIAACIRFQSQDQRKRKVPIERLTPVVRRVRGRGGGNSGGTGRRVGRPRRYVVETAAPATTTPTETATTTITSTTTPEETTESADVGLEKEEEEEEEVVKDKNPSDINKAEKVDDVTVEKLKKSEEDIENEKDQSLTDLEDKKMEKADNDDKPVENADANITEKSEQNATIEPSSNSDDDDDDDDKDKKSDDHNTESSIDQDTSNNENDNQIEEKDSHLTTTTIAAITTTEDDKSVVKKDHPIEKKEDDDNSKLQDQTKVEEEEKVNIDIKLNDVKAGSEITTATTTTDIKTEIVDSTENNNNTNLVNGESSKEMKDNTDAANE